MRTSRLNFKTNMTLLTKQFTTKFETAPFSQIKMEDYKSAFEENIKAAKAEIDAITKPGMETRFMANGIKVVN